MVLTEQSPKHIYMAKEEVVSDMQGPCDAGFHVPTKDEWVALCGILTNTLGLSNNGTTIVTYLKMPYAGQRYGGSTNVANQGDFGVYWSSVLNNNDVSTAYNLSFSSTDISPSAQRGMYGGASIRPFKDEAVAPDSSWTALYSNKIYWNSNLGLISISGDGTNWTTIADKNLGATSTNTSSSNSYGYYFQRGNNYGFPNSGSVSSSSTAVNASTYGPGNYYSSSTWIKDSPRDNSGNKNLRGGVTQQSGTVTVDKEITSVRLGETKVRPAYKPRTFTITRTEKSDMSSGWTYSDDATGLTAGDGAFDDFFGYSAVLLNTSGVETAEMEQSGGVFTGAMTTLGNITSGDNVMIKFPVRGIKMSKSGSTVTLSITEELNKDGYQYYAHSTGTLSNPGTPKDAFYLGAYMGYTSSSKLKSWSGKSPTTNQTQATFCTQATANGSGYNISGWYQRMYIAALYMMKYGNPNSQSVVGKGYVQGSAKANTGGTNSQTNATYGTSGYTQVKLFGLEDRWGNLYESIGGAYTDSSRYLYVQLSGYSGAVSGGENTGSIIKNSIGYELSGIVGNNKVLFGPSSIVNNTNYNTYYCDYVATDTYCLAYASGFFMDDVASGIFYLDIAGSDTYSSGALGSRLMYL